jgi:hypothetical protein
VRHHLVRWEQQYADAGLVVIEVNQSIGEPLEVMRGMVEARNLKHPVLWDADCRNTRAYGVTSWPFAYFIGADGKVFWEGNPSRWIRSQQKLGLMRARIEDALRKVNASSSPSPIATTATHVVPPSTTDSASPRIVEQPAFIDLAPRR